jgi:hypothetical protein
MLDPRAPRHPRNGALRRASRTTPWPTWGYSLRGWTRSMRSWQAASAIRCSPRSWQVAWPNRCSPRSGPTHRRSGQLCQSTPDALPGLTWRDGARHAFRQRSSAPARLSSGAPPPRWPRPAADRATPDPVLATMAQPTQPDEPRACPARTRASRSSRGRGAWACRASPRRACRSPGRPRRRRSGRSPGSSTRSAPGGRAPWSGAQGPHADVP